MTGLVNAAAMCRKAYSKPHGKTIEGGLPVAGCYAIHTDFLDNQ